MGWYFCDRTGNVPKLRWKAEAKDASALYFYGFCLLHEMDGSYRADADREQVVRAVCVLEQAAMLGAVMGCAAMELGDLYFQGKLVHRDVHKARLWYRMAWRKHNPVAACALGDFAFYGYDGDVNEREAAEWYVTAAPYFRDALYRLGDMFREGRFFDRDESTAAALYLLVLVKEEKLYRKNGFYSSAREEVLKRLRQAPPSDPPDPPAGSFDPAVKEHLRREVLAMIRV